MVHCGCCTRNIFDLRFLCKSTQEASEFTNYLDLRKTLTSISMSIENIDDDELDALEEWIGEMTNNIK